MYVAQLYVIDRSQDWCIVDIASLMHTFPFIIWDARGGELDGLQTRDPFYWTGVAALVPQTWLMIMSWGPIR